MKVAIINIGDELCNGKVANTNARDISALASQWGHNIISIHVLPDIKSQIKKGIQQVMGSCNLLIITGGLGPTHDDITRFALASYLKAGGDYSPQAAAWLSQYLKSKGYTMSSGQRVQTWVPHGCRPLKNNRGTACGLFFKRGQTQVFVLPGVPSELKVFLQGVITPVLNKGSFIFKKQMWTMGWSESRQAEVVSSLPSPIRFSSLPSEAGVLLSMSVSGPYGVQDSLKKLLSTCWRGLVKSIPKSAQVDSYGRSLPEAVCANLARLQATMSVAESCTGGGLGFLITSVPGSSRLFQRGYLTYANSAKADILGVDTKTLKKYGAVSEPVVCQMAHGCRQVSGASYACAVTGIAGPGGGRPGKRVGTVWVAVSCQGSTISQKLQLHGSRDEIRWRSAYSVLHLLNNLLKNQFILKKHLHK